MKIKLGTRGSALAVRQTNIVIEALKQVAPDVEVEIVKIQTKGDIRKNESLSAIGGKGLFVGEFEDALREGVIDVAVHSGKDLPSKSADEFCFATLEREMPNDVLLCRDASLLDEIIVSLGKSGDTELAFVFGTASPRRELIMKSFFPSCEVKLLRGNIDTRLDKLRNAEYDAIVLAEAGIRRLNPSLDGLHVARLSSEQFVPAACQGIIACEALVGTPVAELIARINHAHTLEVFNLERSVMAKLGASCHDATGIFCRHEGDSLKISGFYNNYEVKSWDIADGNIDDFIEMVR